MPKPAIACFTLLALWVPGATALAQHPLRDPADAVEIRFARSQPVVEYTLRVDPRDLAGFEVELRLRNVPDTFRLAMVAHPEYDDRYWRFVEGLRVETPGRAAAVAREDSALWRVVAPGGEAVVRYRIHLPPAESPRAAWRPFLTPTGGLVGGPHSFLFVVGAISRLLVSPPGRRPRRARALQLGHARNAQRRARARSQCPARGNRARVLPHLEPDAHPPRRVRRRGLSAAAPQPRPVVERRADNVVRRPAAPARRAPDARLEPCRPRRGAHRPLPREPGKLPLLARERQRARLRRAAGLTGRLQRQHPPAGRIARHDARPDRAGRDERRSLDRRRHACDAGAFLGGAGLHRAGHRADG